MQCHSCKATNEDSKKFCGDCGSPLELAAFIQTQVAASLDKKFKDRQLIELDLAMGVASKIVATLALLGAFLVYLGFGEYKGWLDRLDQTEAEAQKAGSEAWKAANSAGLAANRASGLAKGAEGKTAKELSDIDRDLAALKQRTLEIDRTEDTLTSRTEEFFHEISQQQNRLFQAVKPVLPPEPAVGNRALGVDVGQYSPPVDWALLKQTGVSFAMIREGYGENNRDANFSTNWNESKRAGLIRGAFQVYFRDQDPERQVAGFTSRLRLESGDLPAIIDAIDADSTIGSRLEDIPKFRDFVRRMEIATHRPPIIHVNSEFAERLSAAGGFEGLPLWVVRYSNYEPVLPKAWKSWTFWLFSSTGTRSGVSGIIDLDLFNGTIEDLKKFATNTK